VSVIILEGPAESGKSTMSGIMRQHGWLQSPKMQSDPTEVLVGLSDTEFRAYQIGAWQAWLNDIDMKPRPLLLDRGPQSELVYGQMRGYKTGWVHEWEKRLHIREPIHS